MKLPARYPTVYFKDFQDHLEPAHVQKWFQDLLSKFSMSKNFSDWESSILYWNEVKAHIDTHFEKSSLAFYRNTQDEAAEAEEKRLREEIEPSYKSLNAQIREKVLKSPERFNLEKRFSSQFFLILQLEQDSFLPENIKIETEVSDILSKYTKLTGSAQFEVEGKKYPISHQAKFSNSSDPKLRQESFKSFSSWFLNHRDQLDNFYDECVKLRTQMGKQLGHPDYTLLGYQKMRRIDYNPSDVATFRKQIKEVMVPLASQIRKQQAKSQSQSSLKVWDANYFPDLQVEKLKVEIPEQIPTALKVYQSLSPKLGEHFQKMIDYELIDLPARIGKAPGAFCTGFSDYRVPFIFLNSVGEGSDVTTILHECGHSFQAWESRTIDLLELQNPTLEACEVHSMGMEFLAHPYYEEFFHSDDAKKYRKRHLIDSILILPYIGMVDEFQHRVYSGEANSGTERARVWEEVEKEYAPDIDFGDSAEWRRHRWMRQLHIFKYPFYYIDYAIAQVGAWQLWVQSIKDKDAAMKNYLHLCKLGGTLPLKEFFKSGNLKLPFEPGVLKELMNEVLKIEPL